MIEIDLSDRQTAHAISHDRLVAAARTVLEGEGRREAEISLAVVDDETIWQLNRQYLQHDYATDVLSFVFDSDGHSVSGEVIVSADTAATTCGQYGWSMLDELLLYVIHGMLHLVGYDDKDTASRSTMRQRERHYLKQCGVTVLGAADQDRQFAGPSHPHLTLENQEDGQA